jgi:Leucine-rich repeat (LRR) protein
MKFFCFPIFACRGKVDSLDYSCQKLEIVPDSVLKCGKHLEELDISMNNLCDLPPAFFKLVKMQRLILSFNRFEAIPVQFGDLKKFG